MKVDRTVLTLALGLGLVLAHAYLIPRRTTTSYEDELQNFVDRLPPAPDTEIVVAGASSVLFGIDPHIITSMTGRKTGNFSFAGQPFTEKFVDDFPKRFGKEATRKTLVISIDFIGLFGNMMGNHTFWPGMVEAGTPPPKDLWWTAYSQKQVCEFFFNVCDQDSLILATEPMTPFSMRMTGSMPSQVEGMRALLHGMMVAPQPEAALISRMTNWVKKGDAVYYYWSPLPKAAQEFAISKGLERERVQRELQKTGAKELLIDGSNIKYVDEYHVHADDVPKLSQRLAKALLAAGEGVKKPEVPAAVNTRGESPRPKQ